MFFLLNKLCFSNFKLNVYVFLIKLKKGGGGGRDKYYYYSLENNLLIKKIIFNDRCLFVEWRDRLVGVLWDNFLIWKDLSCKDLEESIWLL